MKTKLLLLVQLGQKFRRLYGPILDLPTVGCRMYDKHGIAATSTRVQFLVTC